MKNFSFFQEAKLFLDMSIFISCDILLFLFIAFQCDGQHKKYLPKDGLRNLNLSHKIEDQIMFVQI